VTDNYYTEPRPARQIPTREQIAYQYARTGNQSKQQYIPKQQASRHRVGHSAGLHPEDTPYSTGDYELEEAEEYYVTRPHSSVRRYNQSPAKTGGNTRYEFHPDQVQHIPPRTRQRITEDVPLVRQRSGFHLHWFFIFGLGMVVMVLGLIGFNYLGTWWTNHQNDSTYGNPRTFQTDTVVGHNDSSSTPSHFLAINLNRHVVVIELPGGDSTKAKIYTVTTLYGDGQDLTPVTLSFKDVNGDGVLDMEIHIQDQTLALINDKGVFRPTKSGEHVNL